MSGPYGAGSGISTPSSCHVAIVVGKVQWQRRSNRDDVGMWDYQSSHRTRKRMPVSDWSAP